MSLHLISAHLPFRHSIVTHFLTLPSCNAVFQFLPFSAILQTIMDTFYISVLIVLT